ncbi:hypothetical protein STEG23_014503, partial [Scotinomys teguina]
LAAVTADGEKKQDLYLLFGVESTVADGDELSRHHSPSSTFFFGLGIFEDNCLEGSKGSKTLRQYVRAFLGGCNQLCIIPPNCAQHGFTLPPPPQESQPPGESRAISSSLDAAASISLVKFNFIKPERCLEIAEMGALAPFKQQDWQTLREAAP